MVGPGDLPIELTFQICTDLSAGDIVNFLSTCQSFYAHIHHEDIWRDLCSRYGISDLEPYNHSPNRSTESDGAEENSGSAGGARPFTFYIVYTRLLHAYGPLLGLWANDHPFRGGVLEFRYLTLEEFPHGIGIVGEVWEFRSPSQGLADQKEKDRRPLYSKCLKILLWPKERVRAGEPEEGDLPWELVGDCGDIGGCRNGSGVQAGCGEPAGGSPDQNSDLGSSFRVSIRFPWYDEGLGEGEESFDLVDSTTQSYYVYRTGVGADPFSPDTCFLHEEFPSSPSDAWYDSARGLPNIPRIRSPLYDNRAKVSRVADETSVCSAPNPAGCMKPPALVLSGGTRARDFHHTPFLGIREMRGFGHSDVDATDNLGSLALLDDVRRSEASPPSSSPPTVSLSEWFSVCGREHQPRARYYPLRFPILPPQLLELEPHITNTTWTGECLAGLWLSEHRSFGIEVLYLEFVSQDNTIKAWKITGDVNVPRGVVEWTINLDERVELDRAAVDAFEVGIGAGERVLEGSAEGNDTAGVVAGVGPETRVYAGLGMESGKAYAPDVRNTRPVVVAIVSRDELRIRWGNTRRAPRIVRYNPRILEHEQLVRPNVRRHYGPA